MAVIDLQNTLPGMGALITYRKETGYPFAALAEAVINGESELSKAEREMILAFVSFKNNCFYCLKSHGMVAAKYLNIGFDKLEEIFRFPENTDDRTRILLEIAEAVRQIDVSRSEILLEELKKAGLGEQAFHDAVITASLACFFNRYIEMLKPPVPLDENFYQMISERLMTKGYAGIGRS